MVLRAIPDAEPGRGALSGVWHGACVGYAGMSSWTTRFLRSVGIVALVTVVLLLAIVVGTGITALSTPWTDFEQGVE